MRTTKRRQARIPSAPTGRTRKALAPSKGKPFQFGDYFSGLLNESLVNCRSKAGLSWEEAAAFLEGVRALCPVEDLTLQTHDVGRALAERYGFSIYDAMIVASALVAGCTTLWSEDMQDGLLVEGQLRIVNPFA